MRHFSFAKNFRKTSLLVGNFYGNSDFANRCFNVGQVALAAVLERWEFENIISPPSGSTPTPKIGEREDPGVYKGPRARLDFTYRFYFFEFGSRNCFLNLFTILYSERVQGFPPLSSEFRFWI